MPHQGRRRRSVAKPPLAVAVPDPEHLDARAGRFPHIGRLNDQSIWRNQDFLLLWLA